MLIGMLIIWLITATGLWLVTVLASGVRARSTGSLLLAALVLGAINAFLRPLLWVLTLPLTVFTFGLFALLINALMVKITAALVPGFEVDSFGDALLAAVIMALLAIVGFIFLQWFLFDAVFWMQMGPGHPRFGI
ncbi:MAG TPA: phage holin family protein [Acidiferrobacteraceae bacterium]|nr:phage holin family protein [Acidiferrobacteraceae bacterium]HEX20527.1 phage holin family protein [Acidiferrobacteraceae bacterium]